MYKKIIVLLILALLMSCSFKKIKKHRKPKKKKNDFYVVKKGSIQVKLEESGIIEPLKIIEIKSIISGKIVEEFFEVGDFIQKGDTIALIEPDFNQASEIFNIKHNLELKKMNLDNLQKEYEYKRKMYQKKFISEQDWLSFKTSVRQAEISYQLSKQQYDLVKNINFENKITPLIADVSGAVLEKLIEEGETVTSSMSNFNSGTPIYRIADITKLVINLNINEIDIGKIWKNQKAEVNVDAFPYQTFNAKITNVGIMAQKNGSIQAFPVRLEIEDTNQKLKPGMTANVTIFGTKRDNIIIVPIRTIFSDEDENDIVYKIESDSTIVKTEVKTGINDLENVEIIKGLKVGDKISYTEPEEQINKDENL